MPVSEPLLGSYSLWFYSCKRPPPISDQWVIAFWVVALHGTVNDHDQTDCFFLIFFSFQELKKQINTCICHVIGSAESCSGANSPGIKQVVNSIMFSFFLLFIFINKFISSLVSLFRYSVNMSKNFIVISSSSTFLCLARQSQRCLYQLGCRSFTAPKINNFYCSDLVWTDYNL